MRGIEALESRRLFAALVPDVGWAVDGKLPAPPLIAYDTDSGSSVYAGQSASRLIVHQATSGGDYGEFHNTTVRRLHADGTPDERFHAIYFSDVDHLTSDADAAGSVVVGFNAVYYSGRNSDGRIGLGRYSSTGRRDKSFNASLFFRRPRDQRNLTADVRTVQVLPDGSVAALIDVDSLTIAKLARVRVTVLAKFTADGTLDKRFGRRGVLEVGTNVTDPSTVGALLADPDGRLYLKTPKTVVRLAASGAIEQGFGSTRSGTVLLDGSGRLVVARPTVNGATVSRYTDAGALDTTFAGDGTAEVVTAGGSGGVTALIADGDTLVLQTHAEIFRISAGGTVTATGDTSALPLLAVGHDGQYLADGGDSPTLLRAATAAAIGTSGKIYIRTSNASDNVYLRNEDSTHVKVGVNGATWQFAKGKVNAIDAQLNGGNNKFNSSLDVDTHVVTGAGRDTVTTGGGIDYIETGRGSDKIQSGGGGDTVWPDAGNNTVDLGTTDDDVELSSNVYVGGKLPGGRTVIRGNGGVLDVVITDGSTASTIDVEFTGRSANVDAEYSAGDNRIVLNTIASSSAYGGEGNDSIVTGSGDDDVLGGGGSDTLRTGAGDDKLYGWDDFVTSNPSRNTLDGGTGEDHYWQESPLDTLIDVEVEEELIPVKDDGGGM